MIGNRLKELRIQRSISQEDLGKALKVTKSSICCYEKGTRTPTIEVLKDLSVFFDVSVDYLIGNDATVFTKTKKISMSTTETELIFLLREHPHYKEILYKMLGVNNEN